MKINVGTLNAFIEAPLPLQHVVARADGVASGPSMGKTFPDGTPYYVRPITGPLLEGMIVVVIAKRRWMGSKGRFFNSIIKRVNKIKGDGTVDIRGDNPDRSKDSRSIGYIRQERIVGEAIPIFEL